MNMFRSAPDPPSRNNAAPHFPIYLLPTLKMPFTRRRRSSAAAIAASNDVPSLSSSPTSTTGTDEFPSSPASTAGAGTYSLDLPQDKTSIRTPKQQQQKQQPKARRVSEGDRLTRNHPDILRCSTCGTDVAYGLQIVSKGFTGRHGRALLVSPPPSAASPSCPAPPPLSSCSSGSDSGGYGIGNPLGGYFPPRKSTTLTNLLAREKTNLVNVVVGRPEPRALVTGAHVVADITCAACGVKIGWKYVDAREQAQKYKVGKFILETERVVLHRTWEDDVSAGGSPGARHFYSSSAPSGSSVGGAGRKASCSSEGAGVLEEDEEGGSGESEEEVAFDSADEDECEDIFAGVWDAATVAKRRGSKASSGSYAGAVGKKGAAGRGR